VEVEVDAEAIPVLEAPTPGIVRDLDF